MKANRVLHVRVLGRMEEAAKLLEQQPLVTMVFTDEKGIHVHFGGRDEDQASLLIELIAQGFQVISFNEAMTNLEDVFLEITKGGVNKHD
ncbi:hypothetical protein D3C73_731660 [compost metagenome]